MDSNFLDIYICANAITSKGRQIIYCDSGEADLEIANFLQRKLFGRKQNTLSGLTDCQSMINKTQSGDFGVYYTSNKTSFGGSGYKTPFMPIELAYWLIKLRKWQENITQLINQLNG